MLFLLTIFDTDGVSGMARDGFSSSLGFYEATVCHPQRFEGELRFERELQLYGHRQGSALFSPLVPLIFFFCFLI